MLLLAGDFGHHEGIDRWHHCSSGPRISPKAPRGSGPRRRSRNRPASQRTVASSRSLGSATRKSASGAGGVSVSRRVGGGWPPELFTNRRQHPTPGAPPQADVAGVATVSRRRPPAARPIPSGRPAGTRRRTRTTHRITYPIRGDRANLKLRNSNPLNKRRCSTRGVSLQAVRDRCPGQSSQWSTPPCQEHVPWSCWE